VPAGGRVATFDMLGDAFMRAQGITPERLPDVWGEMGTARATADLPASWKYDVLIVDEGRISLSTGATSANPGIHLVALLFMCTVDCSVHRWVN
jgi:hypothetical protein